MIELKSKTGSVKLTTPKATGGTVDLSNYYTKEQTDEQIQAAIDGIEIPEVDLSGYAKLTDIPEVPSLDGYATTDYVDSAIEQFDVDLSNYYTKEEVEALIPKYESSEEVEY